jgi:hypothetical protein
MAGQEEDRDEMIAHFFVRVHEERADVILSSVLSHLDAVQIAACRLVCIYWCDVGRGQELWRPLCEARWRDKTYVPAALAARAGSDACGAYGAAESDAKRTHLTRDELCDLKWETRMKSSSGPGWTSVDPWWNGRPPRTRRFYADGRVEFIEHRRLDRGATYDLLASPAAADAPDDACASTIVHCGHWRFLHHFRGAPTLAHAAGAREEPAAALGCGMCVAAAMGTAHAHAVATPHSPAGAPAAREPAATALPSWPSFPPLPPPPPPRSPPPPPLLAPAPHDSSCLLRLSLGEREFPTMVVTRMPNWGFVMQNCWGIATSFALPPRGACAELEDESALLQRVSVEAQRLEANAFNAGLPLPNPAGCYVDEAADCAMSTPLLLESKFVLINIGAQVHRVPQVRARAAVCVASAAGRARRALLTRRAHSLAFRPLVPPRGRARRPPQHLMDQFFAAHQQRLSADGEAVGLEDDDGAAHPQSHDAALERSP